MSITIRNLTDLLTFQEDTYIEIFSLDENKNVFEGYYIDMDFDALDKIVSSFEAKGNNELVINITDEEF